MAHLAAVVTAADAVFNGTKIYYVAWDVNGGGDAYVLYDNDGSGAFGAGEDLVILTGVNLATEFVVADII